MLQKLIVKNYAIIEKLEADFSNHLNIITGETGAGKSIFIGALSLILGKRADTTVLRDKNKKCVVEAIFSTKDSVKKVLQDNDIDIENEIIVRREIAASGKSRAFINDSPVTLAVLKQVSKLLVNLIAQHQTLFIADKEYQMYLLDAIANQNNEVDSFKQLVQQVNSKQKELESIIVKEQSIKKEFDFIAFQIKEIEELNIQNEDEEEKLKKNILKVENADKMFQVFEGGAQHISENEGNLIQVISEIDTSLASISKVNENAEGYRQRLKSLEIELIDLANEFQSETGKIDGQEGSLDVMEERLGDFYRIQQKHGVNDLKELLKVLSQLQDQISSIDKIEANKSSLKKKIDDLYESIRKKGDAIAKKRIKASKTITDLIHPLLAEMGMPNAVVDMDHKRLENANETGFDDIEFLFSANKGFAPTPIQNIASGGELSRLTLAFQTIIASTVQLPTIIFDEIDTGVSGQVAKQVGLRLSRMSQHHQIIAITHLPQVAAKASRHFEIFKEDGDERVQTQLKILSKVEHIVQLAKMLSGNPPSDSALANAKELTLN